VPDDNENVAKTGAPANALSKTAGSAVKAPVEDEADVEHYEEVAEYRIGEGPPPIALVVMFILIVCWATLSWIPFFGY
jgi:hypothetical protein